MVSVIDAGLLTNPSIVSDGETVRLREATSISLALAVKVGEAVKEIVAGSSLTPLNVAVGVAMRETEANY
jgi:hypothetical protein